jgi:hypothetical protein
MSKSVNSVTTKIIACALFAAVAGCDKAPIVDSAQAPKPSMDVGPSIVAGTNIVLPLRAPTREKFISGWDLVRIYDKYTLCQNRTENGCETTENMDVKTMGRISVNINSIAKVNPNDRQVFQNYFVLNQGINAPNPAIVSHVKQVLTLEVMGVCTTADQILTDIETISAEIYADADNLNGGRYSFADKKLEALTETVRKAQKSRLGTIFCSHYTLNEVGGKLMKYESVDGVIQSDPPIEISRLDKSPASKMFLAPK